MAAEDDDKLPSHMEKVFFLKVNGIGTETLQVKVKGGYQHFPAGGLVIEEQAPEELVAMANSENHTFVDKTNPDNIVRRYRVERVKRIVPKRIMTVKPDEPPLMVDTNTTLTADEEVMTNAGDRITPMGAAAIAETNLQGMKDAANDREDHALKPKLKSKK